MKGKKATDVLGSVFARLYEQFFLLDADAVSGHMVQRGNWIEIDDFNRWCQNDFEHRYEGDDVAVFLQKISSETIVSALTYEDEYAVEFSLLDEGEVCRKCLKAFECRAENIVCVYVDDITQQYHKEQSRERIAREGIEMAQKASLERDHFLQGIKEEIMLPVEQTQEVLRASMQKEDADVKAYIEKAMEILEKYTNILNGMFTISAMEKGEEFVGDDVIFTSEFINDLRQMTALMTDGITLEITLTERAKRVSGFVSDRARLGQVFGNALVSVAQENTKCDAKASIDFCVKKEENTDEETYEIVCHMDAQDVDEAVLQTKDMMFVRNLSKSMRGSIAYEAEGENAGLFIRIPIQRAEKERLIEAKKAECVTESVRADEFSTFRALVVDDEKVDREIVVSKLEQFGLRVETAEDGEEAMRMLLDSPRRYYQILFTKMSLPKKSGLDLTMELRELARLDLNDITIVAVTTNPERDKRLTALEHGMDHHLVLPFNDIAFKEMLLRELEDIGPDEMPEKFGFRVLK